MAGPVRESHVLVIGDIHGHLQLELGVAARWQHELGISWEAVFLCGDVGTFTEESQLDEATRRHARTNPSELEFLKQWAVTPQPAWIEAIFHGREAGGLGLTCPVVMIHGNHEGFAHLETLLPQSGPVTGDPPVEALPAVDTGGFIRYLPSGWRCQLASGLRVGGIGGVARAGGSVKYPDLAWINEEAVLAILGTPELDLLLTHQGPAAVQGPAGTDMLDPLAETEIATVWCHGHSVPHEAQLRVGPHSGTTVVPLAGIPFAQEHGRPGEGGWCHLVFRSGSPPAIDCTPPAFLRDYAQSRWFPIGRGPMAGQRVLPELSTVAWRALHGKS